MRSNIGTDVAVAELNSQIAATTGQAARILGVIVEVGAWAEFWANDLVFEHSGETSPTD